MPPKRKAASKPKSVLPKPVENFPELMTSNFTTRRPAVNDSGNETPDNEENKISIADKAEIMNATILIEKMPDYLSQNKPAVIESELECVQDEVLSNDKFVQKKVTKGKSKLKKQPLEDEFVVKKRKERAISVDNQSIIVEDKSKKGQLDKNALKLSKPISSPVLDLPKRRLRAASVDIVSLKVSKVLKDTEVIEDVLQKKNKKGVKKEEDVKLSGKSTKPKKNTKKVVNDEKKENPPTLLSCKQDIDKLLNDVLGKPKSKKEGKKDQIKTREEEQIVENDKVTTRRPGAVPKVKQGGASGKDVDKVSKRKPKSTQKNSPEIVEDVSGGKETDDSDSVPKSPDMKPKRGKKIDVSHDEFQGSDGKSETDSSPEIKHKPVKKAKNVPKEIIEKNTKVPKPRGRKVVKNEEFKEVLKSPPANNEFIENGDEPISPTTLKAEKNENKPVKRKTKARTGK